MCVYMFLNMACRIRKGCYFFKGTNKIQVLKNQTTCFCFWWTFTCAKTKQQQASYLCIKPLFVVMFLFMFIVSQLDEKLSRDRRQLLTQTVQTTPRQCIDIEWPAHFCYLINICRWHTHKKSIGNCPTSRHFMTTTWPLNHPRRTVTPSSVFRRTRITLLPKIDTAVFWHLIHGSLYGSKIVFLTLRHTGWSKTVQSRYSLVSNINKFRTLFQQPV